MIVEAHTNAQEGWLLSLTAARDNKSWALVPGSFLALGLDIQSNDLMSVFVDKFCSAIEELEKQSVTFR